MKILGVLNHGLNLLALLVLSAATPLGLVMLCLGGTEGNWQWTVGGAVVLWIGNSRIVSLLAQSGAKDAMQSLVMGLSSLQDQVKKKEGVN